MVICLFGERMHDGADGEELARLSAGLLAALHELPGFISYNVYYSEDGEELGVVRFESRDALEAWRDHPVHRATWSRATEFWPWFWIQDCDTYREYLWEDGTRRDRDLTELFRSRTV